MLPEVRPPHPVVDHHFLQLSGVKSVTNLERFSFGLPRLLSVHITYIYISSYTPHSTFRSVHTHKHTHNVVLTRVTICLGSGRLDSIESSRGGDLFGALVWSLSGLPSGLAIVGDQSVVIFHGHGDCL